jgi:hypothetical protein
VKREQTATKEAGKVVKKVVEHAAMEAGVEGGAHAAHHLPFIGPAAPLAGYAVSGAMVTTLLLDVIGVSKDAGKELNAAIVGENLDMSILMVAAHADPESVPPGYLAYRAKLIGANRFQHVSFKLATEITSRADNGDEKARELRDAIVRDFNAGRSEAYARTITGPEMLAQAKTDPQFSKAFDSDAAFRQGVLAAMDQATRDRKSFDKNAELVASQRYWASVRH